MTKLPSYLFLTIGFIAILILMSYSGTEIPNKELWIVFSIFFIIIGGFLFVKQKIEALRQNLLADNQFSKNEYLKKTGKKIRVTLDNCEIKRRSFQQEVLADKFPTKTQQLDGLFDGNRNYRTEEIQQTYILFTQEYNGKIYQFMSQPTTESPEILRKYLEDNNGINLYIDRQNPGNYYFDLFS